MLTSKCRLRSRSTTCTTLPIDGNITSKVATGFFLALALTFLIYQRFKYLTLKIVVNVTEYNIRSDAIQWRIPISLTVVHSIFALAFTVSEKLRFEMHDLDNLGQGHRVLQSKVYFSMVIIKVCKSHIRAIFVSC